MGVLRGIVWKARLKGIFIHLLISVINKVQKSQFGCPQRPQTSAKNPTKPLTSESSFSLCAGRASIHQKVERKIDAAEKVLSAIAFGLPFDFRLDLFRLPFFP